MVMFWRIVVTGGFFFLILAQAWSAIAMLRLRRDQAVVFGLLRVWADCWGSPNDEVKAALAKVLRQ